MSTNKSGSSEPAVVSEPAISGMDDATLNRKILELQHTKLTLEVDSLKPTKKNGIERFIAFLDKHAGYITTIVVLIAGVVNPVANFIANERQAALLNINEKLLTMINSAGTNVVTPTLITEVASMDPALVVPVVLYAAQENTMRHNDAYKLIKEMYKMNLALARRSFTSTLLDPFIDSNTDAIEQQVINSAQEIFESVEYSNQKDLYSFYIDLIGEMHAINPEFKYTHATDVLMRMCSSGNIGDEDFCDTVKNTFYK